MKEIFCWQIMGIILSQIQNTFTKVIMSLINLIPNYLIVFHLFGYNLKYHIKCLPMTYVVVWKKKISYVEIKFEFKILVDEIFSDYRRLQYNILCIVYLVVCHVSQDGEGYCTRQQTGSSVNKTGNHSVPKNQNFNFAILYFCYNSK